MGSTDDDARLVKTTDTVFGIVEAIKRKDGATVSELADDLDMAVSTIHDHLVTLETKEYVDEVDGEYTLGLKFLDLGTHAKRSLQIAQTANPWLEELAEETGEVAWLLVEEHAWGVFLMRATGKQAVPTHGRIGKRTHLHTTSAGKAMLAHFSAEYVDEIVERRGLPARTSNTITDRETLDAELERIRERGVAFNRSELIDGHRGVSAPVSCNGDVRAGVGVAGPADRFKGDRFREQIPDTVLGTANAIELRLEYE